MINNNIPLKLPQILIKILKIYTDWNNIIRHIPKIRRYSIGIKIDNYFIDIVEMVSIAQFSNTQDKTIYITKAIIKNDVLKFLLYTLSELKGIEDKHFLDISLQLEEIGRILYGWKNQSIKQKEKTAN